MAISNIDFRHKGPKYADIILEQPLRGLSSFDKYIRVQLGENTTKEKQILNCLCNTDIFQL